MSRSCSSLLAALVLVAPALARAQEDEPTKNAISFANSRGLAGMRDLVDARVPDADFALRTALRYSYEREDLESVRGAHVVEKEYAEVVAGASFVKVFDVGLRLKPIESATTDHVNHCAMADTDVAAKVSWTEELFALAPYVQQELPTGSRRLEHTFATEAGGAATLAVFEQRLTLHANLAFMDQNAGKLGFRYRFGIAFVPWADEDMVLRLWFYVDGLEHEGTKGSEVVAAGGIQVRLFSVVTLSFTANGRIYDGALPPGIRDEGTYGVHAGVGLGLTF